MPCPPVLLMRSWVRDTSRVFVRLMPTPVVLVIRPPAPFSTPVPSPVTVRPPQRTGGVEHDAARRAVGRNALERHIAGADGGAGDVERRAGAELMVLPVPCTVTVPPPVALKPTPDVVVMSRPLPPDVALKLIVAPVLLARLTAVLAPVVSVWV